MVQILNEDDLREWLEGKPHQIAITIAVRAALRAIPFAVPNQTSLVEDTSIYLQLFRANAAARLYAWRPGPEVSAACNDANTAAYGEYTSYYIARDQGTSDPAEAYSAAFIVAYAAGREDLEPILSAIESATKVRSTNAFWDAVVMDCQEIEDGERKIIALPLWPEFVPGFIRASWHRTRNWLLRQGEDWQVWTRWYEDVLRGGANPTNLAFNLDLEVARVLEVEASDWAKGPAHVNSLLDFIEGRNEPREQSVFDFEDHETSDEAFSAPPPTQRPAAIQTHLRNDGRLHLARTTPSGLANKSNEDARQALADMVEALRGAGAGTNEPLYSKAIELYAAALGDDLESFNVIGTGLHGYTLVEIAKRSDSFLMEDAASILSSVTVTHAAFIRRFEEWAEFLEDESSAPTDDVVKNVVAAGEAASDYETIFAEELRNALREESQIVKATAYTEAEASALRRTAGDLKRSIGNVLSELMTALDAYANAIADGAGKISLEGLAKGVAEMGKNASTAVTFASITSLQSLIDLLPMEFGWLRGVLARIKWKLRVKFDFEIGSSDKSSGSTGSKRKERLQQPEDEDDNEEHNKDDEDDN